MPADLIDIDVLPVQMIVRKVLYRRLACFGTLAAEGPPLAQLGNGQTELGSR
jgi:hypothetical protein